MHRPKRMAGTLPDEFQKDVYQRKSLPTSAGKVLTYVRLQHPL